MNALFKNFVRVNVNSLDTLPLGSCVATCLPANFHLTGNGAAERASRHCEEFSSVCVSKLNFWVAMPAVFTADNFPMISGVAFAWVVTVGRNFLVSTERAWENVRVEVLLRGQVLKANGVSTFDFGSTSAHLSCWPFDSPVTVHVVACFDTSDRLLARPCSVFNIMAVKSASVVYI